MHAGHGWHRRFGLRIYVLLSLLGSPKYGTEVAYELFKIMGWRPSPGSLYPVIMELENEGMVERAEDGRLRLTPYAVSYIKSLPLAVNVKSAILLLESLAEKLSERLSYEQLSDDDRAKLREIAERLLRIASRS
ncbi:MAG: PadR family transcriptional regulator [Nitrososphaeria archaeon]|nr:transcriptional regulator, PadR-like family [uncultured archaeon]